MSKWGFDNKGYPNKKSRATAKAPATVKFLCGCMLFRFLLRFLSGKLEVTNSKLLRKLALVFPLFLILNLNLLAPLT